MIVTAPDGSITVASFPVVPLYARVVTKPDGIGDRLHGPGRRPTGHIGIVVVLPLRSLTEVSWPVPLKVTTVPSVYVRVYVKVAEL